MSEIKKQIPKIQNYKDSYAVTLDGKYVNHISRDNFNFHAEQGNGYVNMEIFRPEVDITVGNYRIISYQPDWSKLTEYKVFYADSGEIVRGVSSLDFDGEVLTLECFETWKVDDHHLDYNRDYTIKVHS